jgi:hypothetical protein
MTGVERYRYLCMEHPRDEVRAKYRELVARIVGGEVPAHAPIEYPPVVEMAGNLARSLWGWALTGFATVGREEVKRRLAICLACEHYDQQQGRCTKCGCVSKWKNRLASSHCPLPEPKW